MEQIRKAVNHQYYETTNKNSTKLLHKQKRMDRLMNSKTYEITFMFKLQKQFSVYLTTIIFPSKNLAA